MAGETFYRESHNGPISQFPASIELLKPDCLNLAAFVNFLEIIKFKDAKFDFYN